MMGSKIEDEVKHEEITFEAKNIEVQEVVEEIKDEPKPESPRLGEPKQEEVKEENPMNILASYGYIIEENKLDDDNEYMESILPFDGIADNKHKEVIPISMKLDHNVGEGMNGNLNNQAEQFGEVFSPIEV